ncbi:hypothetical protein SBF1_6080003 [Candidatus Desulfosporosinus infrequens]|uniref:Uncharacterized protein n=1 Tax=Candidatus Desulfosporosinus infrequens TaxID=2043169 RepID=A0A2U3LL82_9FIRM|nr:hypothetical protein SBF1_6080003 [Candidatus Desulfosporosinus infrequens]
MPIFTHADTCSVIPPKMVVLPNIAIYRISLKKYNVCIEHSDTNERNVIIKKMLGGVFV